MANNRRRHANAVPLASIASWVMICLFMCGAGLGYVYLKNQIHTTGTKIKGLERELADLSTQDDVMRSKIASLSSRAALQQRLKDGFIKLVPITDDRLVRVEMPRRKDGGDLRAVSNERVNE